MERMIKIFLIIFLVGISVTNAQEFSKEDELLSNNIEMPLGYIPNYRQEARDIVVTLSKFAKSNNPSFETLVVEGRHLLTKENWEYDLEEYWDAKKYGFANEDEAFLHNLFHKERSESLIGSKVRTFLKNIDGVILSDLYCSNSKLNISQAKTIKDNNLTILSTEHCSGDKEVLKAKAELAKKEIPVYGFSSLETGYKEIPQEREFLENAENINNIKNAKNFLYQKDNSNYTSKGDWLDSLQNTNYDLIIIDAFYNDKFPLTTEEVTKLKYKKNGMRRRVFSRISITEAKDTRYYWNDSWQIGNPSFLRTESFSNKNSLITDYWDFNWKEIIGKYLKSIVDLGFDGVVIEDVDNHKYFEKLTPIS